MSDLVRFGVSLDEELLIRFDKNIKNKKYTNRSEAIRDLIREDLIKRDWLTNEDVVGVITLVYNHHKRELVNHLMDIQHDYHDNILSSQHLHLDEDNCLEILAIKGKAKQIRELYGNLKASKGVKYAGCTETTT
ncbi:MAG: nickel-responsive transcriptional regulator NikR [Candidatus Firestonebacteria bacterium]|nr:nickel-responsive transcriptional regulator NikR [Candidatus Firestonebacteria bacterium]